MKQTTAALFSVLFSVLLLFSALTSTAGNTVAALGDEQNSDPSYRSAFIIWGTRDYTDVEYMGGEPELNTSRDVCSYIYDILSDSQQYDYLKNFWGEGTQPDQVYGNISYCEENMNFTAIFYKGHSIPASCDKENCSFEKHYGIYADEGYGSEYIVDYLVHDQMVSGTHDFVFLWTCGFGSEERIGEIDEGGHSYGMLSSWMDTTSLEPNGYATPDGGNQCFLSFDIYSIWFTNKTTYRDFDYGDFATRFFEYAMYDGWTINDALDAAAEDTHWQSSFGDCQLYTGYLMPDLDTGQPVVCYLRVWGDGNLKLQDLG
jgi:hypothetical protein